jgi:hypothetical protein
MKRILNTPDSWNEAGRDGVVGCGHGGASSGSLTKSNALSFRQVFALPVLCVA